MLGLQFACRTLRTSVFVVVVVVVVVVALFLDPPGNPGKNLFKLHMLMFVCRCLSSAKRRVVLASLTLLVKSHARGLPGLLRPNPVRLP